uniref:Uncharacterized protein n=1 Tax=Avena sativa TaxID=4498 RepID=A0ACD5TIG0_AVESA
MIPFNSAVAAEVRSLVQGADDSNIDSIYRELCQLADCTLDGCILLLQVCLDEVLPGVGVAKNSQSKQALLSTIFRYCLDKPYFSTCFCEALRIVSVSDVFLETLSNELDLSRAERVGIGLSLFTSHYWLLVNRLGSVRAYFIILSLLMKQILSAVLDSTPLAFSIKLATVSFRNDHSHLEKWMAEKLSAQREAFVEECVKFLKEIVANRTYDAEEGVTQQPRATITNICWESCPLFIKVIQSHSGQLLTNKLVDELSRVEAAYESRNHGAVGRDFPIPEGGSDDIEAQANIYFHQMFSEKISIDAMIQMLARFKESTNKRELAIFNCMISNLFEEYKFFPKYPDTQLKLAAVLMGCLIKHQLVAHLGLGIALRSVLDALRKSIDSKMFMFGTTALEQFMDRVIEWPQYCNHILQISHLRGTHAELVSAIEQALAKISSSQNDPNISNIFPVDQHGSGSSSIGSIEASEASWQFINPLTQLERSPSSFPLQQRHQGFLGERSKGSTNSIQAKSQPFTLVPADLSITQKVLGIKITFFIV